MIHIIIVKVDMRNVTRIAERNWRGTSTTRAGIGRNGREFTDIVLKPLHN